MKDLSPSRVELLGTATIGPKGQVVIPAEARERMGIKPGDKLISLYVPDRQAVSFVSESQMRSIIDRMGAHVDSLRAVIKQSE